MIHSIQGTQCWENRWKYTITESWHNQLHDTESSL